ncbi:nucleoporin NSP1-like [Miscanthus floridulus]|uniref:nucleoporin NSP1-like n=1 Tax=Miscanthus floridulus TaxID=154761 RepID=UPI0034590174
MNLAFDGSSGKGHSRSPSDEPPEGPPSDRTTNSSHGDTTGSTTVYASLSDEISTTTFAWDAVGHPSSIPTTLPTDAFGSDGKDRSCSSPPGEIGSSLSLISSTATAEEGATSVTSAVGTGIAANTNAATTALSATPSRGNTAGREGLAAATPLPPSLTATRCSVGLQTSYTEAGAMLNPGIPRSLTKITGKPHSTKTQPARIKAARKHTGWRVARPRRQAPTTMDLWAENRSQAATRAPSLRMGSESSRPAPAWPAGRCDPRLGTP